MPPDSDAEIMQPEMWGKANPSLYDPARTELLEEIKLEFEEYKEDPAGHGAFATKRMNLPAGRQGSRSHQLGKYSCSFPAYPGRNRPGNAPGGLGR